MKTGQAAFEFLTTYGWAFMALLIMLGALSYFGVLNPDKFLPERCTFDTDFSCDDFQLDGQSDSVKLRLNQNVGETIYLQNVTCTFPKAQEEVRNTSLGGEWLPQNKKNVGCDASSIGDRVLTSGNKEKVFVTLVYKLETDGYPHYAEGEVYANVI